MTLIIPQYISMTSSYSHKLVPENHGIDGHRFAPLDFFQSYNSSVLTTEATPEKLKGESNRLYRLAKEDVENRIAETIEEMRAPKNLIDTAVPASDASNLSQEDLDIVAKYIKIVANGGSAEDFEKQVTTDKDKLSVKQKDFLRNYLKTIR